MEEPGRRLTRQRSGLFNPESRIPTPESRTPIVIPAEAGIQHIGSWTPAFAGVTGRVPKPPCPPQPVGRTIGEGGNPESYSSQGTPGLPKCP
jgi:hypothetical protein